MQTLDDAWNDQNVEIFRARHKPDVVVRWPDQPDPTVGIEDHTIAKWHDGQIVEENLMYDLVGFMKQIGLSD